MFRYVMDHGNLALQQEILFKSILHQDSKDVCFGKTADILQVAIQLFSSRLMSITDARHKIKFSFIAQLTYMVCNSEWYRHVPYECHFL